MQLQANTCSVALQPLSPATNKTFELIEGLIKECTGGVASSPGKPSPGVFKDNFVHLGDSTRIRCAQNA